MASVNDRNLRRLAKEWTAVEAGSERCDSASGDMRCERVAGHDGAHFAHLEPSRNSGTAAWSGKGKVLGAFYPKRISQR